MESFKQPVLSWCLNAGWPAAHDYVFGTGQLASVRELIDRAFAISGYSLDWQVDDDGLGFARFAGTSRIAVESVPHFYHAAEPKAIRADPSRAWRELGWRATSSIDGILRENDRGCFLMYGIVSCRV